MESTPDAVNEAGTPGPVLPYESHVAPPPPRNAGVLLSAMMFLQFFIRGAWYVTVGNYMAANGMTDAIFWAYTVGPIAAIISPFFLGMVADRFFPSERVLGVMHLIGALAMFAAAAVGAAGNETLFIVVLLVHMLAYMPTLGLTNTVALHAMSNPEKQFPLVRVFGTLGWIAANWVVSKGLDADTLATQFYVTGAAGVALGVFSFFLPHTPPPAKGQPVSARAILGIDSLSLMRDRSFAMFILSSFLICIPLAAYYAYAPVFVGATGFRNPAFTMSFGQISEVLFMLVMPLCFAALGVKWMLLVGMLAWVVRYGLFAGAATSGATWMVVGGIVLHGICYDFFFVTGFIYTDRKAGPAIRAQAQGFLVLVTQGLGMLIGAQLSGALFNNIVAKGGDGVELARDEVMRNWQQFWLYPCVAAAVVMIVFFIFFRE